jgi:hypothetical protein
LRGLARIFLETLDRIRDTFETIDATQFGIHAFIAKLITYLLARFDGLVCFVISNPKSNRDKCASSKLE